MAFAAEMMSRLELAKQEARSPTVVQEGGR
jgi:hypothetical protein